MLLNEKNYHEFISAKRVKIGKNVHIGKDTKIIGPNGKAEYVEIGDNVVLDRDIFIMTPTFKIGDYGKIYKNTRISGYKPCIIGHNFWCDQNTILNCTDELIIGNNVGIGAYSQLWTHIKFGDILEGSRFNSTKKMIIEDDVWFVGHCIVSPIHAKAKSMAMVGSVITKDMEENHIYGGSPAKDLTDKLGTQFILRSFEEKYDMMSEKLKEFMEINNFSENSIKIKIVMDEGDIDWEDDITYFIIKRRTYTKKLSKKEIAFMTYILPLYKYVPLNKTINETNSPLN